MSHKRVAVSVTSELHVVARRLGGCGKSIALLFRLELIETDAPILYFSEQFGLPPGSFNARSSTAAPSLAARVRQSVRRQSRSPIMTRGVTSALAVGAALGLGATPALAGPCTARIAQFEQAVQRSAGTVGAGPMEKQSVGAQLRHQPTPN